LSVKSFGEFTGGGGGWGLKNKREPLQFVGGKKILKIQKFFFLEKKKKKGLPEKYHPILNP